jgi:O-antigen ligase
MLEAAILVAATVSLSFPEIGLAVLAYQPAIQHAAIGPLRVAYALAACIVVGLGVAMRRENTPLLQPVPRVGWAALTALGAFFVYVGISAAWSPMPRFALERAVKGLAVLGVGWLAFSYLSRSPDRLRRFLLATLVAGVALTALGLAAALSADWHRTLPAIPGEKSGLYRQAVGMSLVLAVCLLLSSKVLDTSRGRVWLGLAAVVAFQSWSALQTGGRGLLLATALMAVCLVTVGLIRRDSRTRAAAAAAAMGLGLAVFLFVNPADSKVRKQYKTIARAAEYLTPAEASEEAIRQSPWTETGSRIYRTVRVKDAARPKTRPGRTKFVWDDAGERLNADPSLAARLGLYRAALKIFREHLVIGSGTGGYWVLTDGCYPHNVTLEVASELGTIGLLLGGLWLFPLGFLVYRHARRGEASEGTSMFWIIAGVFAFALVYAQLGSVLDDNKILFLLTPAILLVPGIGRGNAG